MRMIEDEHDDGRQLWCAVIQQALFDATQPLAKLRHVRMEQLRAREWLTVPNNDFAEVCAMAGIDADRVRAVATVRVEEARKNDPDDRGVGHSNPKRRRDRFTNARDDEIGDFSVITLDQAKAHLRVTIADDDALITDKLAAAKAWVGAYTASNPDDDATSAPVNEAVLQLTAHLYENREASLVGVTASALPFGFLDLLANYRAFAF